MNKQAFLIGYIGKEAFIGQSIGAAIKGAPAFLGPLVPGVAVEHIGGKLQDAEINEYREQLGLPPDISEDTQLPSTNTQKRLQEEATEGSVSLTT